jgi:hypothetical protein
MNLLCWPVLTSSCAAQFVPSMQGRECLHRSGLPKRCAKGKQPTMPHAIQPYKHTSGCSCVRLQPLYSAGCHERSVCALSFPSPASDTTGLQGIAVQSHIHILSITCLPNPCTIRSGEILFNFVAHTCLMSSIAVLLSICASTACTTTGHYRQQWCYATQLVPVCLCVCHNVCSLCAVRCIRVCSHLANKGLMAKPCCIICCEDLLFFACK